jgi:hypothetical protein
LVSRLFGNVRQNGYVVEDINAALDHWTKTLGIGPFYKIDKIPLSSYRYRGEESPVELAVALGFSGGIQFELIQQLNDAPSPYLDFVRDHGFGLQHISSWSEQYDRDLRTVAAAGISVIADGKVTNGPRFCYFDTGMIGGTMIEMADFTPEFAARAAKMERAAREWDGIEPIRPYASLLQPS